MPRPTTRGSFSGYFIDWIDRAADRGVRFTRVDSGGFVEIVRGQMENAPADPPTRYRVEIDGPNIRVFGDPIDATDTSLLVLHYQTDATDNDTWEELNGAATTTGERV